MDAMAIYVMAMGMHVVAMDVVAMAIWWRCGWDVAAMVAMGCGGGADGMC